MCVHGCEQSHSVDPCCRYAVAALVPSVSYVTLPRHAYVIYTPAIPSAPASARQGSVFKTAERQVFSALEEGAIKAAAPRESGLTPARESLQEAAPEDVRSTIWSTHALSPRQPSLPAAAALHAPGLPQIFPIAPSPRRPPRLLVFVPHPPHPLSDSHCFASRSSRLLPSSGQTGRGLAEPHDFCLSQILHRGQCGCR